MRGIASMKVTSEPSAVYTSENSSPMYPDPMIAIQSGTCGREAAVGGGPCVASERGGETRPLELERLVRGEDGLAVRLHSGRHEGHRARREDDILRLDGLSGADKLDAGRAGEGALLLEDGDAEGGERAAQVALHAARQVVCVVRHALPVVCDGALELDAHRREVLVVLHVAHAARGGEEGLGRDAAAVDARAAHVLARAHGHLEPARHGVQRRTVAADAAANDEKVLKAK